MSQPMGTTHPYYSNPTRKPVPASWIRSEQGVTAYQTRQPTQEHTRLLSEGMQAVPLEDPHFVQRDRFSSIYAPKAHIPTQATEYKSVEPSDYQGKGYTPATINEYPVDSSDKGAGDHYSEPDKAADFCMTPPQKTSWRSRYRTTFRVVQWLSAFLIVGFLLAIPMIVTADARDPDDGPDLVRQTRNLEFYLFAWLLTTWILAGIFHILALCLPYLFRFIAHYVNPAQKRYWRAFVMLRWAIVFLGTSLGSLVAQIYWVSDNPDLSVNYVNNDENGFPASDQDAIKDQIQDVIYIINSIIFFMVFWSALYTLERFLVMYMTIHFQYRSNHNSIKRGKAMLDTLVRLYEVSYSLYPKNSPGFAAEDFILHDVHAANSGHKSVVRVALGVTDQIAGTCMNAFGIVFGSSAESHWFKPRSTYAIINHTLQNKAASAALAKRIWMSLAAEGRDAIILDDLKEALGPRRHDEAEQCFKVLDENENGDVRLSEMVSTVVEAGQIKRNIYLTMADISHVINSIDWIMLGMLALIIISIVLVSFIQILKDIKELIGFSAIGLSFVVGRTLNEFVQGAIFTILDHPYDIGDVVELHNMAENLKVLLVVKRISLLYTIFEEVGSAKMVQFSNNRSKLKRISNLTRSGLNREQITLSVDFKTTFKDIQLFRNELQQFLLAPANCRDYHPDLCVRVTNLHDLTRLELNIAFTHKSNWSNEMLRAARSSRFFCAIVAAARKVPIVKPGHVRTALGDEGKPSYTVMITDTEAAAKRAADELGAKKARADYVAPATATDPAAVTPMYEEKRDLSAEQIAAVEAAREAEAARQKAEAEAKVQLAREEEAAALDQTMIIPREGLGTVTSDGRHKAALQAPVLSPSLHSDHGISSSVDGTTDHSFVFITGDERGVRRVGPSRQTTGNGSTLDATKSRDGTDATNRFG